MPIVATATEVKCFHCGQLCEDNALISLEEKKFCCTGCRTVYEILDQNNLCEYYAFENHPGISSPESNDFDWLDEPTVCTQLLNFNSDHFAKVELTVPSIHCISCLWLLEKLPKVLPGVLKSEVKFARKSVAIDFNPSIMKLSELAQTMASLGYQPHITLDAVSQKNTQSSTKTLAQLAVAGFCFGNIMLLSFPEYLGLDGNDEALRKVFSYLNLALALPVLIFSGRDYLTNAIKSFSQHQINIDVPIAIGFLALYFRSAYDIFSSTGPGYLDSFSGLVFFLLIGRWFQSKTYESLAFDRDYKSYFPLAVYKLVNEKWKPQLIYDIKKGDHIKIRNGEVVPADCTLIDNEAYIDYSFVTGEARPVKAYAGTVVFAGGRLIGKAIEVLVDKPTSQSHLTSLWNNASFHKKNESRYKKIIDQVSQRFTWAVLAITILTGAAWYFIDPTRMWLVITAVLIVACPCALALAAPFTYGSMMRVMGRYGLYLKNADVIERLAAINAVVFDKTGTVTNGSEEVTFVGVLNNQELSWVKSITGSSVHPLSQLIDKSIAFHSYLPVKNFRELPNRGIAGEIGKAYVRIGSADFVGHEDLLQDNFTRVFVSINNEVRGYFKIETKLRANLKQLIKRLGNRCVALLSGDKATDYQRMRELFPLRVNLFFNQSPHDKLQHISNLQQNGYQVMMVGDGLNDSGALSQSDVGIAVSDDAGIFTPACDAIISGKEAGNLDSFLQLSKSTVGILRTGFAISIFYNFIALGFAVTGHLSPMTAAILMPASSISVVGFSAAAVYLVSKEIMKTNLQKS